MVNMFGSGFGYTVSVETGDRGSAAVLVMAVTQTAAETSVLTIKINARSVDVGRRGADRDSIIYLFLRLISARV